MSGPTATAADGLAALKIDRSRKRRRVSPWVWIVLVAGAAAAFFAPMLLRGLWVRAVTVAPAGRLSPELTAAGYVVADRQSVLAAKFTGRLKSLNVAESDFVKKGTVVAEIDHTELDAAIAQAEAEVTEAAADAQRLQKLAEQADAELLAAKAPLETFDAEMKQYDILLTDADRRLKIAEKLVARNAVPVTEVDDRRTEVLGADAKINWTKRRRIEAQRKIAVGESQAAVARSAVRLAEARQKTAAAKVKVMETQRDESFIRSPFDGRVTEKAAEVGEIVAPISIGGSMARGSIVTIADWASLQAEVDVAESQLGRVKDGQRAEITVDAIPKDELNKKGFFEGKVRRILPRADRSKATVKVRVDFVTRDMKRVLPDMGVRVRFLDDDAPAGIETGAVRERVGVPKAAVCSDQDGDFVWIVRDDTAKRCAVTTGAEIGGQIEITSGVNADDKVVVRGAEKLSGDSAKVRLVE